MNLGDYFSKIRRAFLVLLLGRDGKIHLLVICCAPNLKSATALVPGFTDYQALRIDREGHCEETLPDGTSLYFSHIQFAGVVEPKTGKAALALLPEMVIYNGMEEPFLQSFAHFRDHPGLHGFAAVIFQPNATLALDKDSLVVGGKGHVAIIRATPLDGGGRDFEVSQYGPGERLGLTSGGKSAIKKSADPKDS